MEIKFFTQFFTFKYYLIFFLNNIIEQHTIQNVYMNRYIKCLLNIFLLYRTYIGLFSIEYCLLKKKPYVIAHKKRYLYRTYAIVFYRVVNYPLKFTGNSRL